MENIRYNVHYIYDAQDNLDCLFISHDKTCFAPDQQIVTLNMKQFEAFIKTVKDVTVQWDCRTPNQIREWEAEKASM